VSNRRRLKLKGYRPRCARFASHPIGRNPNPVGDADVNVCLEPDCPGPVTVLRRITG
jgi:hypothetical protein